MDWIKKNKLVTALLVVVLLLVAKEFLPGFWQMRPLKREIGFEQAVEAPLGKIGAPSLTRGIIPQPEYPPTEQEERLIIEESRLSLVVLNVRETTDKIIDYAKQAGGFMVSTSLTHPEEAPFATVVVRVPAENFREAIDYFRTLAVKVSSENILGTDVTAEYVDIEARLATLEKTKAKFESILAQATAVSDILQVQRELINLQEQIDSLKGRKTYLEKTAKLAKITVYLSTDEFALPYVPAKPFRPSVIFKQAVRSLIGTARGIATLSIWIVVYAPIWIPILFIIFFIRKWRKKPSEIK
ncbi:MAG: hypothetical protein LiPW16_150 [Microgenomates group bacterium LiPW_16]|nr:MAG: hypothetical protein LiPW16_150 [Microgenomates group bacterium LiPW_16]